jgi:hypothetical protein
MTRHMFVHSVVCPYDFTQPIEMPTVHEHQIFHLHGTLYILSGDHHDLSNVVAFLCGIRVDKFM